MSNIPNLKCRLNLLLIVGLVLTATAHAGPIEFTLSETAGLRRFGYPVTASLVVPKGTLDKVDSVRLVDAAGRGVPAQFTATSIWPDGSVRGLDVDFDSSLGPMEIEAYRVEFGVTAIPIRERGLTVTETADEITVTSSNMVHKIRRDGQPLMTSIIFREREFLASGGVTTTLKPGQVEVLKRGPLNVTLRLGPVLLTYVSGKSWVKIEQHTVAPAELAVDVHFALPEPPVLWDFGVESWLYGFMEHPSEAVLLRQEPAGWKLFTGEGTPSSLYAVGQRCQGWGHLQDKQRVVAFGVSDFDAGGEPSFRIDAEGRFHAAARRKDLMVSFHFVGQPVQVTAATSPPSMLSPLVVTVKK